MFATFLQFVGFYALACYLYENLRTPALLLRSALRQYFGCADANSRSLPQKFGKWAAITGSTDGIGKAYARELARRGLNIVLISRSAEKLKAVADEIASDFNVQTKIIVADFTHGQSVYEHIERELQDLPVGILVNNVGQGRPQLMHNFSADELWQFTHTNIAAVTQMTRLFVRRMRSAGIKGIIVNISSGTELQPAAYGAFYAASKAFTRSLTFALQHEVARYGIAVQLVSPFFVVTKINSYSKYVMRGGLFIPDPETYARWAVATIGQTDETSGYVWHGLQTALIKIFPWRIRNFGLEYMRRYFAAKG